MKKEELWIYAGVVVLIALLAAAWLRLRPQPAPPVSPATQLLSLSLTDTDGQLQHLSQWKGKTLIVNFWATWCAPCIQEMPELSSLQVEVAPAGKQVIGIGIDSASNIAKFAEKYKIAYPLYTGGMNATDLAREFGDTDGGLPFTVVIDGDGRVRNAYLGRLDLKLLRQDLARL